MFLHLNSSRTFGKLTLGLFRCILQVSFLLVCQLKCYYFLHRKGDEESNIIVDVSLWFTVSQFMFVKVYISVKVQLKCITVDTPHCTIYTALALWLDYIAFK